MRIHIVSEVELNIKGEGVNTSFVNHIELMREKNDVDVIVNEEAESEGDVFHSHTYGPYFFWKGRHYKGRRVITAHVIPDSIKNSIPFWKPLYPFVKWYFKKVFSYADVCIAISPTVEQKIRELGVITKIVNINNPVLTDKWKRTKAMRDKGRQMLNLSENEFVVLGVGQLIGRKGVDDFIDIAKAIPEVKFVWAGGRPFGKLSEDIKRLDKRIENASYNIQFKDTMELDDMPYIYAACDLFLFPSLQENCPLAPIEAAASGMPVVFRNLEEYKSLYKNPYLSAGNKEEFIEITRSLIYDKAYYNEVLEMSENLVKQFDKNEVRKKLLSLYEDIVKINEAELHVKNVALVTN